MKQHIEHLFDAALKAVRESAALDLPETINLQIEHTKDKQYGDFACNVAMMLAKAVQKPPREVADIILQYLPTSEHVAKIEIAGPGFLNIFMAPTALQQVIKDVIEQGEQFGRSTLGDGQKMHVEFVSANPTGPLHVGHGRGAAYGAAVSDLLEAVGYQVHREYYVNDAGRQMDILAVSTWLRYLELCGETFAFPKNGYRGQYVIEIAQALKTDVQDGMLYPADAVFEGIPDDESEDGEAGDKEAHIDGLVMRAKELLGKSLYKTVFNLALNTILDDIKDDLTGFGVRHDEFYSERSFVDSGELKKGIKLLKKQDLLYEKDGALWFRSTDYGDEKDRVIVRANGVHTYFATDLVYHVAKFERGYHKIVDIFGADHHGYIPRMRAGLQALGHDASQFTTLLYQFVILYRGGERVQMSTRSGSFVTLRELREEVGNDAARFFNVMRRCDQHMDFDLDLAKSKTNENPVYYIQYAHARVCSIFRQLDEKGLLFDLSDGLTHLLHLDNDYERNLLNALWRYPEIIEAAATQYEPYLLANYLRELANDFHTYYNAHQFIVDDAMLRSARLALISAVRQVLQNGLKLLGVTAPETM